MTLSKEAFLASLDRKPTAIKIPGGEIYVRPVPESIRCLRVSRLYDEKGQPKKDAWMKDRIYSIIDQVVDPSGSPMFVDGDYDMIAEKPASEIDLVVKAIEEFNNQGPEKNGRAGSSDTSESSNATTA